MPLLLDCQRWILLNILSNQPVSNACHGYVKNRSIITNAREHIGAKALLKVDLKDFYPSIKIGRVIKFFNRLGYTHNVSSYLASICCLNDELPQGAATSPYLSNVLFTYFDNRIERLASTYNLKYTRYADDLTFSGRYIPHDYIQLLSEIVSDGNFQINEKKTRLIYKSNNRIITGISVANDRLRLPRSTRRQLRQEAHYIKSFGLLSHVAKNRIKNPHYLKSLLGKISFWLKVEPDSIEAKDAWETVSQAHALLNKSATQIHTSDEQTD